MLAIAVLANDPRGLTAAANAPAATGRTRLPTANVGQACTDRDCFSASQRPIHWRSLAWTEISTDTDMMVLRSAFQGAES